MNKEQYLLLLLQEECAEISHRVSKAIRFTLNEKEPNQNLTNKERLIEEINDLFGVIDYLQSEKILPNDLIEYEKIKNKIIKIDKFLKYSRFLNQVR